MLPCKYGMPKFKPFQIEAENKKSGNSNTDVLFDGCTDFFDEVDERLIVQILLL